MVSQTLGISRADFWIRYCLASSIIILWNWRLYIQLETHQRNKLMHFPENTGSNIYKVHPMNPTRTAVVTAVAPPDNPSQTGISDRTRSTGATSMSELWSLSASEVARLVRTRKVSAREVADSALRRLDSGSPLSTAVVDCRPDLVRKQAERVDSVLANGNDPGPLAGVPVTVKLNIDQAGFATSDGSRLQENLIAKFNSPAVDNVVRAGAVLLGRSNMPTFAMRWFTSNLLYGGTHTKNPRDPQLTPGGSSGGGAAGVAAGIGHIALGTDIGGSVRYPAYACGIHGLRP